MAIEDDIYARLIGYTALNNLVGGRIYPNIKEQDAIMPAVEYRRVSTDRDSVMQVDSGIVGARFQVDVWADDYDTARAIKLQVRGALQRYKASNIFDIFVVNEVDLFEGELRQHHLVVDFMVHYAE